MDDGPNRGQTSSKTVSTDRNSMKIDVLYIGERPLEARGHQKWKVLGFTRDKAAIFRSFSAHAPLRDITSLVTGLQLAAWVWLSHSYIHIAKKYLILWHKSPKRNHICHRKNASSVSQVGLIHSKPPSHISL